MEFFKKRSGVFFRGVGAEFVFKSSDGISLVSGGRILKVRVEGPLPGATASRVVLVEPDGADHVIFEGDAVAAAAKFVEIANEATSKRTPISVSRKGTYAVLAAFTAVYLIFCHPAPQTPAALGAAQTSASDLGALLKSIPAVAGGLSGLNVPSSVRSPLPPRLDPASHPQQSGWAVMDKPSFLALPEDETAAAQPSGVRETEQAAAIPAYSADLYKQPQKAETAAADKAATVVETPVASEVAAKPTAPADTARADEKAAAAKPTDVAVADASSVKADTAAVSPTVTDTTVPQVAVDTASSADKGKAKPAGDAGPEDADAAKKAAAEATKNMSAAETAELLKQIEQMMQMDPTAITPDMLAKLPHEIAQTLRDTGVIGNPKAMPEKGNAPYAAIRLPAGVIDKFRGRDGIASIPENDTFAALGNKIPLQLPGGGDIRKPEDLKLFGFEP